MPTSKNENWLLLRGLARGQGHWGSFLPLFQKKFPHAQIECLDLPGNGLRNKEKSPLNIRDYVQDLRARSAFVQEKKPFNVLALSMGAMITVEWMHRYPHEIEKAYLVCTSSARHSRFYQRLQPKNLLTGLPILAAKTAAEWETGILSMITNDPVQRQKELPALIEFSEKHPVHVQNVIRQLLAASRYRFPRKAPGDITLIGSYGDRFVAPECTLQLAKAWGLETRMNAEAGHDVPIDNPRWLIEQLL
ncbi:alpha/beta hydrolase [Bdellovibrio bacteriovorus]|uniref:Alpha/beta hydrolase n=1 Tax=Bdellovibrio bacteriovorus TaxID=959 RepID=A0A150WHG3_BDEBC|nr:alpha/beta hydrolase [Bdellovibrio bacteriovorus]KYG63112.1 alpha/beta hydrolase [Bdellovibrio bacteriovorus]